MKNEKTRKNKYEMKKKIKNVVPRTIIKFER